MWLMYLVHDEAYSTRKPAIPGCKTYNNQRLLLSRKLSCDIKACCFLGSVQILWRGRLRCHRCRRVAKRIQSCRWVCWLNVCTATEKMQSKPHIIKTSNESHRTSQMKCTFQTSDGSLFHKLNVNMSVLSWFVLALAGIILLSCHFQWTLFKWMNRLVKISVIDMGSQSN